jgi:ethanolamine utilization protein EutA
MIDERFLSLGLDIGTTTTHLIFSEIEVALRGDPGQIPRPTIGERRIVHRGGIRFTPLAGPDRIDLAGLEAVVRQEYAASGFRPEQVRSGAVLVTGETARKDNAEEVARRIADLAGGFVAAAAGPNLESVLAGRGAGAGELSRRLRKRVLNIDIGGGTSNFAWFERGRCTHAGCLRVGGRHVQFDPAGKVTAFTEIGKAAADEVGVRLAPGETPCPAARGQMALALAEVVIDAVSGPWPTDGLAGRCAVTRPAGAVEPAELVLFSGGVGELMSAAGGNEAADPLRFGDLGPELAAALLSLRDKSAAEWDYPAEPIRATVIGAGMYAAQVSGDTIWIDPARLPLTNLPVLRPFTRLRELASGAACVAAIRSAAARADLDWSRQPAALLLPSLVELDLTGIENVAASLLHAVAELRAVPPLVLVMSDDLGRTLGRLLAPKLNGQVLAVDELDCTEVEYVDIGRPVGDVVPVVLKSLVFG